MINNELRNMLNNKQLYRRNDDDKQPLEEFWKGLESKSKVNQNMNIKTIFCMLVDNFNQG